jgi:DNA-binding CsgD family transcriptional regulator
VRSEIPATRAAFIRRELADALEATGARRNGDLLRLATWCLDTGKPLEVDLYIDATGQAERSFAPALAERLGRAAEAAGGGVRAGVAVARALSAQGRFGEAERVLSSLEGEHLEDGERVLVGEFRARVLAGPLGRREEALAELARARLATRDPSARATLAVVEAFIFFRFGDPRRAVASVLGVIDDQAIDEHGRSAAAAAAIHMLAQSGRPLTALALAEKWRAAFQATAVPSAVRAEDEFAETIALLVSGRIAVAKARALDHYAAVLEAEQLEMLGRAAWCCGAISLCQGAIDAARTFLLESIDVLDEVDPRGLHPWALALLSQVAGHGGDAAGGAEALAAAEAAAPAGEWNFTASLDSARAWTSAAGGALSEARRWAYESGTRGREHGQLSTAFLNLHDVVRFGAPERVVEPLTEVADDMEGDWARACAFHAVALAERDADALRRVSDAFEDIGALLFAAEASAEAAKVYRGRGREPSARSSDARARVLLSHCAGARTPALVLEPRLEALTARQREIAALAARGSSNKDIAARLVLSVRTVENQLQQAYRKLGITSRGELRSVLEVE